ncbi:MAG: hypothetical protein AB7T27_00095 [Kiritimatiellia bacterium]
MRQNAFEEWAKGKMKNTAADESGARAVAKYYAKVPPARLRRLNQIRRAFRQSGLKTREVIKYQIPALECSGAWVGMANQKDHICVYFRGPEFIRNIRKKHPELSVGVGCVRIRDSQEIPLREMVRSFKKAMKV